MYHGTISYCCFVCIILLLSSNNTAFQTPIVSIIIITINIRYFYGYCYCYCYRVLVNMKIQSIIVLCYPLRLSSYQSIFHQRFVLSFRTLPFQRNFILSTCKKCSFRSFELQCHFTLSIKFHISFKKECRDLSAINKKLDIKSYKYIDKKTMRVKSKNCHKQQFLLGSDE